VADVPLTQQELGARIAAARAARGLSQQQLAERIALTQSAVSRIEAGSRAVESLELARIAQALTVSVVDLLDERPLAAEFRVAARLGDAPPTAVDTALARVTELVRLDRLLDDVDRVWPRPAMPRLKPPSTSAIDQGKWLAERVRREWSLGDDPIPPNLFSLIEDLSGLAIALEPLHEQVAGLCARVGTVAIALIDSSVVFGRQRFTAVHELAHYLIGDGDQLIIDERILGGRTTVEIRANAFAAHFLMPAKSVVRYLRGRDVEPEAIVELQFTFGVSLDALLWHLFNLDLISDYRRRQLHDIGAKALASRHGYGSDWHRLELERDTRRPPRQLYQRAIDAYARGLIGIEPVADLLGRRDREQLRRELEDHGIGYEERWWEETAPA
jgi:Zn-dependent peptidase ImmA (M78 family)/DNA-binding XRE family transcriptional regulator